jgi:predicted RNase H-like nuclease (RuvC/YqgF family)
VIPELVTGGGIAGTVAAIWAFLRTEAGKALLGRLRRFAGTEVVALKEAVDNLSQVVSMQGDSIEWLRGELERTRTELTEARVALTDKESKMESENVKLRKRVAELEAQVKALEAILAAKTRAPRKTTIKKAGK